LASYTNMSEPELSITESGSNGLPLGRLTFLKSIHLEWFADVGNLNSFPVALGPLKAQIVAFGHDGSDAASPGWG
jgi:hypothetical protein